MELRTWCYRGDLEGFRCCVRVAFNYLFIVVRRAVLQVLCGWPEVGLGWVFQLGLGWGLLEVRLVPF